MMIYQDHQVETNEGDAGEDREPYSRIHGEAVWVLIAKNTSLIYGDKFGLDSKHHRLYPVCQS